MMEVGRFKMQILREVGIYKLTGCHSRREYWVVNTHEDIGGQIGYLYADKILLVGDNEFIDNCSILNLK